MVLGDVEEEPDGDFLLKFALNCVDGSLINAGGAMCFPW